MTKTDFAELKEKLVKLDIMALSAEYVECCKRRQYNGLVRIEYMVKWQHSKDAEIISELIEIIQIQSDALELSTDLLHNAYYEIDQDTDEYKERCIKNRECTIQTTARLQKLRDGNNGNKTN